MVEGVLTDRTDFDFVLGCVPVFLFFLVFSSLAVEESGTIITGYTCTLRL